MHRPGTVLSREQLEDAVYGWGDEIGSNAIEVHLQFLRRKLGTEAIRNVRGVGYRVAEPSPNCVALRQERSAWRRRSDP